MIPLLKYYTMRIDYKINLRANLKPWKKILGCELSQLPYMDNKKVICSIVSGKSIRSFCQNPYKLTKFEVSK